MKCAPGCTCGRHRSKKCLPGCECGRHRGNEFTDKVNGFNTVYFNRHTAVRRARGRAAEQVCVKCDGSAAHWAMVHGTDGSDPWVDFVPLCISCHHAYDKSHERAGFHGRHHSEETKAKLSAAGKGRSWLNNATPEQRVEFGRRISEARKRSSAGEPKPDISRRAKTILTRPR